MSLLDGLIFGYRTITRGSLGAVPQRSTLHASTGLTIADDASNDRTIISLSGGGGGGGSAVLGTGIPHVVADVTGAYASLIVNADVDVSAAISVAKLAPPAAGVARVLTSSGGSPSWVSAPTALPPSGAASGSLAGSYPSPTVVQIDGNGTRATVACAETVWGSDSRGVVSKQNLTAITTSNATPLVALAIPLAANRLQDILITVLGKKYSAGSTPGDFYRADLVCTVHDIAGTLTLSGGAPTPSNIKSYGVGSGYSCSAAINLGGAAPALDVSVVGLASNDINWSVVVQSQQIL